MQKDSDSSAATHPDVSGVHIWLILLKAYHALLERATSHLDGTGLGDTDFRVLEVLLHKGPLPVNTIGPKVFLTPGSISTAVDRLHEKGLVTRIESEDDRRVRLVGLTPKGRALIKRLFQAHAEEMEAAAQIFTPAERLNLADALKKLGKNAQQK